MKRIALLSLVASCAGQPAPTTSAVATATQPAPAAQGGRMPADTNPSLIPAGFGTLKEADISITLQPPTGVRVTTFPLDESVIRTLAPDSYRAMHANAESRAAQIRQRASMHGERNPSVWFVRFYGLVPDARYDPTDVTVSVGGRDFRPFDVIPISGDFATQRLQPRETQIGLLLFDGALDVTQPLVVRMGAEQNTDWDSILRRIDAERAGVRARAGAKSPPPIPTNHPPRNRRVERRSRIVSEAVSWRTFPCDKSPNARAARSPPSGWMD